MTDSNSASSIYTNLEQALQKCCPDRVDELLTFAKKLFKLAPVRELEAEPISDLAGMVLGLRLFMERLDGEGPKLRSFNPNLEEDGWEHRYTQIFILQRDMAFLVDSSRMALSRQGLGVHGINSTIFEVVRSSDGHLQQILSAPTEASHREALIYFQVDHYASPEQHKAVLDEIREVLASVSAVNQAHIPCIDSLNQVIATVRRVHHPVDPVPMAESIAFLEWLRDNHFTFLAYSYYSVDDSDDPVIHHVPEKDLGLFNYRPRTIAQARLSSLPLGLQEFHLNDGILTLAKSSVRSIVHRYAYCDYVIVKDFDSSGRVVGEHRFLGLYTSLVYSQSPFEIPLVRLKLHRIYDRSGLNPTGHYGKVLRQIIEVHPREELFHGSEDQLYDILLGIWQINERRLVKLFVRPDPFNKFINCIVYFPRDSYRTEIREKAEQLLIKAFDATESQFSTFFSESSLARTHFVMRISSDRYLQVSVDELERQIAGFTNDWRDDLHLAIIEHWGDEQGILRSEIYRSAFPVSYQAHFDPRTAVHDIALFDDLVDEREIAMSFFQPPDVDKNVIRFKIFHLGSELPLSRVVPMLENLGFLVIGEHPYPLSPAKRLPVWVHDFNLSFSLDMDIDVPLVRQNFIDAFRAVWHDRIDDDSFNWLVIGARLDWRSVALLRAYARYMKQLGISISQGFIATTLAQNLEITRNLVALFKTRFDPKLGSQDSEKSDRASRLEQKILAALDDVRNLNQDQVLRTYLGLLCATVRTNFYQRDESGEFKNYIAFKLKPRALTFVPEPKPEFEIFVYSARVEGVHLRAGKVARGGIRWSDRFEDYRTEILGLVKAQQVKNAVIVPTGAKGGFVAKKISPNAGRDERFREGQACYSMFIQGLLDITDNIVDGQIVPPPEVVRLDEDDPYLVVAADKGTATFSDLANSISDRYGHWLSDAFASGGSHGYDHKKMAITAKGAWVAVQRHFREMGVDPQTQPITVLGIGDMSGDVFGNGMLLSPCIRLLAAFNHNAIFIDPNPNAENSWRERKRLFELPSSNWTDYNREIISAGGGVFLRSEKTIRITAEIAAAFAIAEPELAPDKLIKILLKSQVDLVWNGGIGTYVKSQSESHLDVGDRNNDNLRINGRELSCKVFAEGGNLGITQKGRVEYCLAGGRCNTDFIDNSGGVDCSDQEVNIKIALNRLVANQDLTHKQRNQLLEEMAADVAQKVLHHNYRQTQAISLARLKAQEDMSEFLHCITDWEATGLISRSLENLPDDETLADREKNNLRLARPELATLLSYSKILFKEQLLATEIALDSVVEAEIFKIFPALLGERYPQALRDHALKREVICNHFANEILDLMGLTFVHRQMKSTGAGADDIVRAYLIVREVLDFETVWGQIEALDQQLEWEVQANLLLSLMHLGRRTTRWVIRNRRTCVNIQAEVLSLKPILGNLLASSIDQGSSLDQDAPFNELRQLGLSPYAAMLIDSAGDLFYAFGMADVAIRTGAEMGLVQEVYAELGEMLQLEWLSQQIIDLPSENRWEDFAREAFVHELENQYRALAVTMVEELANPEELSTRLHHWQVSQASLVQRWNDMIAELKAAPVRKYAMFSVALQVLRDLVDTTRQQGNLADFCALPSGQ